MWEDKAGSSAGRSLASNNEIVLPDFRKRSSLSASRTSAQPVTTHAGSPTGSAPRATGPSPASCANAANRSAAVVAANGEGPAAGTATARPPSSRDGGSSFRSMVAKSSGGLAPQVTGG